MRIIQIIDSLESGGAERMAVSYANALIGRIEFSGLVVTRKEGPLFNQIDNGVSYLFLEKKKTLDFKAVFRLRNYVRLNKVAIVHAHGTSFFIAFLLKLIYPKVRIIWHEHYGGRVKESITDNFSLFFSSLFFSSIFVVNHQLEAWAKKNLLVKKVLHIPNFTTFEDKNCRITLLKGNDEKRIVCLANLKNPKNHLAILIAFQEMKLKDLGWSLHFIGKDYNDDYSVQMKKFIHKNNLENFIFIYGSKNDIKHILSQVAIGILASTAEGFPVALLEYGCAKLPVVSTNVGYCPLIIKDDLTGLLFDPLNQSQLQQQLNKMISEKSLRDKYGLELQKFVFKNYSKEKVITLLLNKYKTI